MKIRNLVTSLILTTSVLFSTNAISSDLDIARSALKKAHKAFLNKKYKKVSIQLKKTLKNSGGNEVIDRNAFELLNAAHKERGEKKMPADWELPQEISYMKIGFRRQFNKLAKYTGFKINISGKINKLENLEELKLLKYPNKVIIDLANDVGKVSSWEGQKGPNDGFYIGKSFEQIDFDGLYFINIKLKGEEAVKGWFISSSMKASTSPVVKTPIDGEIFEIGTPDFYWSNFFSPEYQGYEKRRLYLKITNLDSRREKVWSLNQKIVTRNKVIVGEEGDGLSILPSGPYLFHVNYGERKKFGPLVLSRDSRTVISFEVK